MKKSNFLLGAPVLLLILLIGLPALAASADSLRAKISSGNGRSFAAHHLRVLRVAGGKGGNLGAIDNFMARIPDLAAIKPALPGSFDTSDCEQGVLTRYIYFPSAGFNLDQETEEQLDRWASYLFGQEEVKIEIIGHTDNIGSAAANLLLSEQRAVSVATYLINAGVEPDRIRIDGVGGAEPRADNETLVGRARNRRVEIRFLNLAD